MKMREEFLKGIGRVIGVPITDAKSEMTPWGDNNWWGSGSSVDESGGQKKAVYTSAFWLAPPYGRPRDIDYDRLESLEKSVWVRMCVQHITDSIANAKWSIVPRIKGESVPGAHIEETQKFFEGTEWSDSFSSVLRTMLPDMLQYDAGVLLKSFGVKAYSEDDGTLLDVGTQPLELYARDGRSFLKDTDLFGKIGCYWQYSWLNPQGRPIKFAPQEILYLQQHPQSREPYGISTLEIIEEIINYMIDSTQAQSKYWKNGMFIGGQIDMPEVKDFNEIKKWQAYFEAKLRGSRKFGKWLVTGGGTKVQSLPFTPQQMQWIDSQKWFAKMVFGVFKVAPSELGFTEDLNRATGVQQMEIHKSKAIRPVLTILEEAFNRQIVWSNFYDDVKFEFDQELDLEEQMKQTDIDVKRLQAGLDSVNELRDRDGKEKWADEKYDMPFAQSGEQEPEGEGEEGSDVWDNLFGQDESPDKQPMDDETKKMYTDIAKAVMASAASGTPGFTPIPYAYDGLGTAITKEEEKALEDIMAQLYSHYQASVKGAVDGLD
jgi:hypothetical protein